MDTLLVIEDDLGIQKQLKWHLSGYKLVFATNRHDAITALRRYEPKVVTLDLGLPPDQTNATEGLKTLQAILSLTPNTKVIVITGSDEKDHALQAIEQGAHDFYQKPIDANVLTVIIDRAYHLLNLELENIKQQHTIRESRFITGTFSHEISPTITRIAQADRTTLIIGESGTGKKTVAREIHQRSNRKETDLFEFHCSLVDDSIMERELFGCDNQHIKKKTQTTVGFLEQAHGGTLIIDEISLLPMAAQMRLLQFLRTKKITHSSNKTTLTLDVNVVCTNCHDLHDKVHSNDFLAELYIRLSANRLDLPALRHRVGDIMLLATHFLQREKTNNKYKIKGFSDDAIQSMCSYGWPGNIAELYANIRTALLHAEGKRITRRNLPYAQNINREDAKLTLNLRTAREDVEKRAITQAITISNGNISKAAGLLGITRPTLYTLLEKHNMNTENN